MSKKNILIKITILSFINNVLSRIVLPLELLPRDNYKLLYPPNSSYDIIDNENRQSFYTEFEIGKPKQIVPMILKPKSNFFILTNICSNLTNITSEDNFLKFNFSKEFISKYDYYCSIKSNTSKLNYCRDSEYYYADEYCSYNDYIIFYEDFNLTNKTTNIKFETVEKMADNITGEIGLSVYNRDGRSYDSFLGVLRASKLIDNYNCYFDFNSNNSKEAKLIIGSLPHDDFPSLFRKEDLMFTETPAFSHEEFMQMKFTRVFMVDNNKKQNITYEFNVLSELVYDSNIILGDPKYKNYLLEKMKDLISEEKCFSDLIKDFNTNRNLTFIYCKKDKKIKDKLTEIIKPINFYSMNLNYTFELTKEEILKEIKDYIFIQVLFSDLGSRWNLGKLFTLKYKFVFNQENKVIGFYTPTDPHNNNNEVFNNYKYIWIVVGIAGGILLILLGYFLGKYIYQVRKKRANELLDEYEYKEEHNDEKNINTDNVILDENNNIN